MAAGDLTDLASVEAWLSLQSGNGSEALLSALITAASTFVKSWLNRDILSTSYVERYRANGDRPIVLANGPVTAIAQVAWQGTTVTTAGDPIVGTPGIYFTDRALSLFGYCLPRGDLVQVSYTAGYATVPADIKQVVNELVGEAFKRRDRIGQNSKTLGGQEVITFSPADMNATNKTLLQQYRNVVPVQTF